MIYLDNAATTRPLDGALVRAQRYLTECYYNPSALYHGGAEAARLLQEARSFLVSQIADPARFSMIFTSCGSEADNQAIFSAARRGNAVTTLGEHSAVFESFKELKSRGVEPRFAPLHADGSVDADALLDMVDEKTTLVSVIHVSNETGAVNDIAELARRVKQKNPRTVFHSDGVQAFGKVDMRLGKEIDLYSVSAHKIGALKGTGACSAIKTAMPFPHISTVEDRRTGSEAGRKTYSVSHVSTMPRRRSFPRLQRTGKRSRVLKSAFGSFLIKRSTRAFLPWRDRPIS